MEPVGSNQIEKKVTIRQKKVKEAKWTKRVLISVMLVYLVFISSCSPYFYFY